MICKCCGSDVGGFKLSQLSRGMYFKQEMNQDIMRLVATFSDLRKYFVLEEKSGIITDKFSFDELVIPCDKNGKELESL